MKELKLADRIAALRKAGAVEITVTPDGRVRGTFQRTVMRDRPALAPVLAVTKPRDPILQTRTTYGPGVVDHGRLLRDLQLAQNTR